MLASASAQRSDTQAFTPSVDANRLAIQLAGVQPPSGGMDADARESSSQWDAVASNQFEDSFGRPNGAIGNGWSLSPQNAADGLVITDGSVRTTVAGVAPQSFYRPIDISEAVTASATFTDMTGFDHLRLRYHAEMLFGSNGDAQNGYGIFIVRGDQSYSDSRVYLVQNGTELDVAASTFQFGSQIHVEVTYNPNGSIAGVITDGGNEFVFSFGPREVELTGSNFQIALHTPDPRFATTHQTVDNVVLADAFPNSPPTPWETLALLSHFAAEAYNVTPNLPEGWAVLGANALHLPESDFEGVYFDRLNIQALAVFNDQTNELVLSFRGTDEGVDWLDYVYLGTLIQLKVNLVESFTTAVQAFAQSERSSGDAVSVYITGHSLGGAVAEAIAFSNPSQYVAGAFIGSPGSLSFMPSSLGDDFVHVTRGADFVGLILNGNHAAQTLGIDDYEFLIPGVGGSHNHIRYADQLQRVAESPLSSFFELNVGVLAFLEDDRATTLDIGTAWSGHGVDRLVFGGQYGDTISAASYGDFVFVEGGFGNDVLTGSTFDDILSGGWGADHLEGLGGDDVLFGGAGGDRFHIGVGQGVDTIRDEGHASGEDVLVLYTGSVASVFSYDWFTVEGANLRVRVPDGLGGWAIDVLIEDMGTTGGRIERVELWAGDGTAMTDAWDLARLWAEKTQAVPPLPPTTPTPPDPGAPATLALTSGDDDWDGGAGDDIVWGASGNDVLDGFGGHDSLLGGAGNDVLRGGGGEDIILDDDARTDGGGDFIDAGDGDDTALILGGIDYANGGAGIDTLVVDYSDASGPVFAGSTTYIATPIPFAVVVGGGIVFSPRSVTFDNFERLVVFGGASDDALGQNGWWNTGAIFSGAGGNDILTGGAGDDTLDGGIGDDDLNSGTGVDWIDGGAGYDEWTADLSASTQDITYDSSVAASASGLTLANGVHVRNVERASWLSLGSGDDQVWDDAYGNSLNLNAGDDWVHITNGVDAAEGGAGVDTLIVDYSDATGDVYAGGTTYIATPIPFAVFVGGGLVASSRSVTFNGFEHLTVFGGAGNDQIGQNNWWNAGATFSGAGGNDILTGGAGDDTLRGGSGDDDLNAGAGVDWIDGGTGFDEWTADYSASSQDIVYNASLAATGGGVTLANGAHVRNVERVGWLSLGSGDDQVSDDPYGNSLNLGGGDDWAQITNGVDSVEGGAGDDTLIVDYSTATGSVYAGGTTYIATPIPFAVFVGGGLISSSRSVTFSGFEHLTVYGGSGADTIGQHGWWNTGATFFGGGGNDSLIGGTGADLLIGGAGADALNGGDGVDTADYATSTGRVVVRLSTGLGESAHAQGDTLSNVENLIGSAFNDALIGSAAANALVGGLGNDYLDGGAANDVLTGGEGDDRLVGGIGADQLIGGAGIDLADYSTGTGRVVVRLWNGTGEGGAAQGDTLSGIENITGTTANDALIGDSGANVLRGGAGDDRLDGLEGNDHIVGGTGADTLLGGMGVDTVSYEDATGRVVIRISNQTAAEGEAQGDIISGFEHAIGGASNDALIGDGLANTLDGRGGNDYLDGGAGNDNLTGGLGDDRLVGGAGADALYGGDGIDLADYSSATTRVVVRLWSGLGESNHAQGDTLTNIENVTGGSANDSLIGADTIANALRGGGGDDYLDGLSGNDYLDGGAGVDRMNGGAGADTFAFVAGQGNGDRVLDFASGQDQLRFEGYGAGATLTQLDATHWRVASVDGLTADVITIANAAALNPGDWLFV